MDSSAQDSAPKAQEVTGPAQVEATETPAVEAPTAPNAPVDDLAKATETSSPFGTLKRRTTDAWNSIPKPAVPTELPQFPSISSELPTQESARETFGTLKRRTTETFGSLQRRTTNLMKNVSVPSVPEDMPQMPTEIPKWADFSGLASKLPTIPWGQGQPAEHTLPATWERIFVPSLPRSSHSINVVGGNAYIFGGEVEPRKPVDNDIHLLMLPYSSASADYVAIKAKAAPRPESVQIPTVVEPIAEDEVEGKDLSDVDLASPAQERGAITTGSENIADEPDPVASKVKDPTYALPDNSALGDVPSPRVGHATAVIGSRIFLFGGRGGPDMAALEEHGRVWVFDTKTNLWSYLDPRVPAVEPISPAFADKRQHYPAARSYHSAVGVSLPRNFSSKQGERQSWAQWAQGDSDVVGTPQNPIVGNVASNSRDEDEDGYGTLIIHGGCFTEGRANDVWAFDVRSKVWKEFPSAPGAPRGGTTLALASGKLWRFGGFNGEGEEGGQLDYLTLLGLDSFKDRSGAADVVLSAKGAWKSILPEQLPSLTTEAEAEAAGGEDETAKPLAKPANAPWPGDRSVAGLQTVTIGGSAGREYLLLLLGERDPSDDGHNAAGKFWNDIWAYELPRPTAAAAATSFVDSWFGRAHVAGNAGEGKWFKVATEAYDDEDVGAAKGPGARGWFATAHMGELEERGVVLWGGVDGRNSRLGDGWILRMGNEKREA